MFRLASFTDSEQNCKQESRLAQAGLAPESTDQNLVLHDAVRKQRPLTTLLEWEGRGGTPEASLHAYGLSLGVRARRCVVWGLCRLCLERFDQVSPKSQTMPAVPGKAGPGLLRFVC